jgi:hypothetical protein
MAYVRVEPWVVAYVTGFRLDGSRIEGVEISVCRIAPLTIPNHLGLKYDVIYASGHGLTFDTMAKAEEFCLGMGYIREYRG